VIGIVQGNTGHARRDFFQQRLGQCIRSEESLCFQRQIRFQASPEKDIDAVSRRFVFEFRLDVPKRFRGPANVDPIELYCSPGFLLISRFERPLEFVANPFPMRRDQYQLVG
jgi:hypothetical protein